MSELSRIDPTITPNVFQVIVRPAAFVMENLEVQGFEPVARRTAKYITSYAWNIGRAVSRLHLALSQIDEVHSVGLPVSDQCERDKSIPVYQDAKQFIHGDLNTKNILLSHANVRFVDFERCRLGSVTEDIGWCLGHLLMAVSNRSQARLMFLQYADGYGLKIFVDNIEQIISVVMKSIDYRSNAPVGNLIVPGRRWHLDEVKEIFRL